MLSLMLSLFYKMGELLFDNFVLGIVLSALITLVPIPTLLVKMHQYLSRRRKARLIVLEAALVIVILTCGMVYSSHFQFPDNIVFSKYSTVEKVLLDESDNKCTFARADGYAVSDDSYVFEVMLTDSGKYLSAGDIIKKTASITLYTTYDYDKIAEYQAGTLTLEQMQEVVLERITATNKKGSFFVGDKVEKSDIKVVAYYSDQSERELTEEEYQITSSTVLEQRGDNIITISYTEGSVKATYELTVEAEKAVLKSISAQYVGPDLVDGEELDPANFTVTAKWSDDRESVVEEGQFEIDPQTVTEGANTITVTYEGKKATCKITAYSKDEIRPIDEVEPNNNFSTATKITAPCSIDGKISSTSDVDIYEVAFSVSGCLNINVTSEMEYTAIYVYASSSSEAVWYSEDNQYDSSVGVWKKNFALNLSKGIYQIKITGQQYSDRESTTGSYNLTMQFDSANCTESGGHTTLDSALEISADCDINDQISLTEWNRFYRFEVTECVKITFETTSYINYLSWWLYPETETDSFYSAVNVEKTASLGKTVNKYVIYLEPGSYYLRISGRENDTEASNTGNYSFSMSAAECEISEADTLGEGTLKGMVAATETSVQYGLTLSADGRINLTVGTEEEAYIEILTTSGNRVWYNTANAEYSYFEGILLDKGSYYVVINKRTDGGVSFKMSYVFVKDAG
ncbi:MAG: bacterial Ig-like domain-containing protein [Clostridiales bacterium]|nr:bacterial Ig-like domain-containing protein [Clostridiales bacterium]